MSNRRKYVVVPIVVLLAVVTLYVVFMLGRYSFLLGKPELILGDREKWLVARAREQALEIGIPQERLTQPRVIRTVKVLFGGGLATGGVEVIVAEQSGVVLQMSH